MKKIILILSFLLSITIYADVISDAYAEVGKGNHQKAREIFTKACENKNSEGCVNLGLMYKTGAGVTIDYIKAVNLWEKACAMNNANGCIRVAFMYGKSKKIQPDQVKAKKFFKKACTLGESLGCEMDKEYK